MPYVGRVAAALGDLVVVAGIGGVIASVTHASSWPIFAIAGLTYFTLATICVGQSFVHLCVSRTARRRTPPRSSEKNRAARPARVFSVIPAST